MLQDSFAMELKFDLALIVNLDVPFHGYMTSRLLILWFGICSPLLPTALLQESRPD